MKQSVLRGRIFYLWIAFWIISTALVLFTPWLRTDKAINSGQVLPAILSISGIWIPPLTLFASFWFPEEEQSRAKRSQVNKDRANAAIVFTVIYLVFVLVLIAWTLFFIDYLPQADELPSGASFQERLGDSLRIALIVSPLALAPVGWITRSTTSSPIKDQERRAEGDQQ